MAYCYECGEQVAENDVFCPYCGISLTSIAVAGAEDDDSLSKTIIGNPFESAAVEKSEAGKKDLPEIASAKLPGESADKNTDDFSTDVTAESLDMKTDSAKVPANVSESKSPAKEPELDDELKEMENLFAETSPDANLPNPDKAKFSDIQPPKNLQTINPLVEPLAASGDSNATKNTDATAEQSQIKLIEDVNLEPVFVSSENDVVENSTGEDEKSQTESSLMSYDKAEIKEVLSADEPEKSADDVISDIEKENLSEPSEINDFDAKETLSSGNFDASAELEAPKIRERLLGDLSRSKSSDIAGKPISMPDAELPDTDNCPPSRFDSVSIMEKKEADEEASLITKKSDQETETPSAHEKSAPENENRSFTQPNIGGGGDTGGKNKTKLKPLDEGTILNGRYEIVRKIGGGGMGAVYLASDKNLGGVLRAVKEMVQSYIEDAQQEKAVNDFKRESLLLTSLDHQSIPTIYDYFFDEKEARFYLVMKYISGGDLSSRLRSSPEGRINETEVAKWAVQIADVLDYLHNRQPPIVYRDLKPANIMVDSNSGRAMLIDFGIARWVNKEEKGVTAVGTMGYAPPELFSGNVEPRSDIYSLGSTMFHLLTGADPQSNPLLIFDFQKHPRPRQINPQLSDQMERILMRAVEYSADKRFASAAEMRQSLEDHLENQKAGRVTFGVKEAPVSIALSDQPVFCGFCGQKIVATDMFCAFCGAKQPLAQQGVHSESYSPTPLTAQLLIVGTNDLETPAFRLEKENNLVGRRDPMSNIFPEVDLSKYDPQTKISRRHARIWRTGSEFMVEDLGSSNGTYILPVVSETVRLQPHQPQLLTNGDKIRLGDTTLHFILG